MFTIKVKFGKGFTLTDVKLKCDERNIKTNLIKDVSENGCYYFLLEIDNKYHNQIIDILDLLELKDELTTCIIELSTEVEIDITKLTEFNSIQQTRNKVIFSTNKHLYQLLDYLEKNLPTNDMALIKNIECDNTILISGNR